MLQSHFKLPNCRDVVVAVIDVPIAEFSLESSELV